MSDQQIPSEQKNVFTLLNCVNEETGFFSAVAKVLFL